MAASTTACAGGDDAGSGSDGGSGDAAGAGSGGESSDESGGQSAGANDEAAGENAGGVSGAESATSESSTDSESADVKDLLVPIDCDTPPVGLGACWSFSSCNEGADEFNAEVLMSICIPDLGLTPTQESCSALQLLGRCYDPIGGSWAHSYYGYMRPTAAELEEQCLARDGGVWCTGPLGVPDATSRECRRACDEARPDYTEEPECLDADTCFSTCLTAVAAEGGCAECVTQRIQWPAGACYEFECTCPPATF